MEQLPVGYQNAQAVRQQALGQGLGLAGQTFQPTAEMINQGGMMNQNALLAGLQLQRNAILGKDMDYSTLQAMSPQMDYAALSGLMNPQGLNFKAIEPIKNTFTTTQADIQSYLDENKDIEEDYKRQLPELRAGDPNNPNYKDIQSYGRWHYDNIGKYEIEQGKRSWSGGYRRAVQPLERPRHCALAAGSGTRAGLSLGAPARPRRNGGSLGGPRSRRNAGRSQAGQPSRTVRRG